MPRDYYNTNRETGRTLRNSQEHNRKQEHRVLLFFRRHPGRWYTRDQVNDIAMPGVLYTSVGRCLTNLTHRGLLRKSRAPTGRGRTGKQVYRWTLIRSE